MVTGFFIVNGAAPGHIATDLNGHKGIAWGSGAFEIVVRLATLDADPDRPLCQRRGALAW